MNLGIEEKKSSDFKEKNKMFIMLIGLIVVAIIVVLILLMLVGKQGKTEANSGILVNGQKVENLSINDIYIEGNDIYFPIKDIASSVGYDAYNDEYIGQTEATDKCHVENAYESASFFENENYIYKMSIADTQKNYNYEEYQISQPVKNINGKLYVSAEGLGVACNLVVKASEDKEKIEIYTLEYWIEEMNKVAVGKGMTLDYESSFENQKAILKGFGIVKSAENKYGVIDINGNQILGMKYNDIKYDEYTNLFEIKDSSGKVGLWQLENNTGVPKISNNYDTVTLMDKEKQLYLVSNNQKYGVVNGEGTVVVEITYDEIGINQELYNVKNKYVLYDDLIPVKRDGKWGFFNLSGQNIISIEYDSVGFDVSKLANKNNYESIVMVPEYGLIVLEKDGMYGLVNWKGEERIQFLLSSIYYYNGTGEKKILMESDGMQYDLIEILENNGIERYEAEEDIFSDFYNAEVEAAENNSQIAE